LEIAQIRAKALLREVTGEIPPYKWSYNPGKIVRNITAATFGLGILSQMHVAELKGLEAAARNLALAWEALAKLEESTSRTTALMNAAVDYQLAGYQANARCLARKIGRSFREIDTPKIEELSSAFLQRLFLQVVLLSRRVMEEPKELGSPDQLLGGIARAIAAEGFNNASRFFLMGDGKALDQAGKAFAEAEKSLASLGLVQESNLIHDIGILLPAIQQRSIWTVLANLVKDNQKWKRYLKLLSRGMGQSILNSPSVSELWPSQLCALENGLLSSDSSKVVKMPTSAGKTRVAELAIVHTLITKPGSKCVYIAPYRALVYELEQTFLDLFGDLGFIVSSVIGSYETDEFEELLTAEADILVMTPEKLDLLQRAQPDFLNNVRLFVLDEGQIVQDPRRGVKFELLLTRLKRKLPNARFLFLSAVVPKETLEDFALWFNANPKDDLIVTDWRPSIQRVAKFEWQGEKGVLRYSPEEDISLLREFVSGVVRQQTYEFVNEQTGRTNRKRFPDTTTKAQTAAELAYKFAELGPVLVFCSQPNFVEAVAKSLEKRLDYIRKTHKTIPSYFSDSPSTRSFLCAREWLGESHSITNLLKNGIAIHHGNLPDVLRKAIELDFRNRRFQVLIATNTLAQGVNLPIRTVVVHSCWRMRPDELPERIPARDYWNIAGRAGRAGRETEGTIIHIVMRQQDENDYEYYLEHRSSVEEVHGALFKLLLEMVFEGLSESAIIERLDPETLALLVEENVDSLSPETIQAIMNETLVQKQAARYKFPTDSIQKAFENTADNIKRNVPNMAYWPVYSSTGLQSNSCELIRRYIAESRDKILNLFKSAAPKDTNEMVALFLEACQPLPEMRSEQEFGGSYSELLQRWLNGTDIDDIVSEFGNQAPSLEELAKFVEDYFTYRLPWGISAFLRIAMKELDLKNEQIPDFVKFFPTMVKFGVPVPAAAWAISAGIPFRRNAIEVASKYLEQATSPSFEDFSEWLSKLHSEELHYEFGLEGSVLEDVSRSLSQSSSNALLKAFSSSEEILPTETYVRGIAYENRVIVASSARVGQSVDLVRDYDNPVDHNAVSVLLNGQTLGFLERDLAQLVAPDMDCGLSIGGTIVYIDRAKVPQIKIRIIVRE